MPRRCARAAAPAMPRDPRSRAPARAGRRRAAAAPSRGKIRSGARPTPDRDRSDGRDGSPGPTRAARADRGRRASRPPARRPAAARPRRARPGRRSRLRSRDPPRPRSARLLAGRRARSPVAISELEADPAGHAPRSHIELARAVLGRVREQVPERLGEAAAVRKRGGGTGPPVERTAPERRSPRLERRPDERGRSTADAGPPAARRPRRAAARSSSPARRRSS